MRLLLCPFPFLFLRSQLFPLFLPRSLVPEARDAFGAAGLVPVLLGFVADPASQPEAVRPCL
jgi:hypothetical protein